MYFSCLRLYVLFLLLQEKYQKKQSQGALKAALIYALRAAFGGCAPKRACGRSRASHTMNYGMIAPGDHDIF